MRVDPSFVTNLVGSLDQAQSTQQQLTAELSSGMRVSSLSQDPIAAGENVQLLSQIQRDDSFTQSSDLVKGQLNISDSVLGNVVSQLTSAISLATSANNGTMNATDLKTISTQIDGIRSEVMSLANTSYQGRYIFAGSQTSTVPFAMDTSTTPATTIYNGDEDVNSIETSNGQSIQLNVPGDQIFSGSGVNNVFAALNKLVADYAGGTASASAVTDTQSLNSALNYVSQQRVTIDNSLTRLTAATDTASTEETQLTTTQTNLMQADVASVATHLTLAETQQTALESVISQLGASTQSLFSKL